MDECALVVLKYSLYGKQDAGSGLALSWQYSKEGAVLLFGLVRGFVSLLVGVWPELPSCSSGPLSPGESIPLAQVLGEGWLLRLAGPCPDSPGPKSSALDSLRLS